jgi:hypothetical protein
MRMWCDGPQTNYLDDHEPESLRFMFLFLPSSRPCMTVVEHFEESQHQNRRPSGAAMVRCNLLIMAQPQPGILDFALSIWRFHFLL